MKRYLFIGMIIAFFLLGVVAMQRSMPISKPERLYKAIEVYSPYKFEKYIGGLKIVDIRDGHKETPNASEVLLRMDELQKKWGKNHLSISQNTLFVIGENNQTISKIAIETKEEREWLKNFFGI